MKLTHWLCAAALIGSFGACKKAADKDNESKATGKTTTKEPAPTDKKPEPGTGSASGSATTSTPTPTPTPTAGAPMTGEQMAKKYADCWGFFNDRKFDDFKGCFDAGAISKMVDWGTPDETGNQAIADGAKKFTDSFPDAKGDVQMTFVYQNHIVGVVMITGTNDGPLMNGQPATHKKIGFLIGHVIDMDPKTGLATSEWSFIDQTTMLGQLGVVPLPHREPMTAPLADHGLVAVGTGSDAEKAAEKLVTDATDAFNKHDAAAYAATRAASYTFYDSSTPADVDVKTMTAGLEMLWKAFTDLKSNLGGVFGAGEWVVSYGTLEGTNDGPMAELPKPTGKKISITQLSINHVKDGKLDRGFRFVNGLAIPQQLGLMPQ